MKRRSTRPRRWALLALVGGATLVLGACSGPKNRQNSFHPAGPYAHDIDNLFRPIAFLACGIGLLVFALLLVAIFKFRERPGHPRSVKQVHGNTPLEITWTVIPAIILAVISVPTIATVFHIAHRPTAANTIDINVVGKQWWWQFEYPNEKVVTANEIAIPVDTPVRLSLRACDPTLGTGYTGCSVIHSFWVPELAGKMDVVPGRTNHLNIQANRAGTYLGQCAQFCGLAHADMRMRVIAMSKADYQRWIANEKQGPRQAFAGPDSTPLPGAPQLMAKTYGCINCHTVDDSSKPSFGPNLTHLAARTVFASGSFDLTRDDLVRWVRDAPSMIPMQSQDCLQPPPAACVGMPSFVKHLPKGHQPMTQRDAETIADYLLGQK
jgi:cytochrome c oxidase subunit 2